MRFNHSKIALNLLVIAGLAGGCREGLRTTAPTEERATTTIRARTMEPPALPPAVTLPTSGCALEGPIGSDVPLRLVPGGRPFATLKGAGFARVHLGGAVEAVATPLRLAAIGSGFVVYPKKAIAFGERFVPTGKHALPVVTADDTHVTTFVQAETKTLPCAAVSLEPSEIDLSLFDEGDERRVGDHDVTVLDRRGDQARVVRFEDEVAILDWVPQGALRPARPKHPPVEPAEPTPAEPAVLVTQCDRELAVVAEVDGVRRHIGAIDAGGDLVVGEHDHDFTSIEPYGGTLKLASGARLLVRTADLELGARCASR